MSAPWRVDPTVAAWLRALATISRGSSTNWAPPRLVIGGATAPQSAARTWVPVLQPTTNNVGNIVFTCSATARSTMGGCTGGYGVPRLEIGRVAPLALDGERKAAQLEKNYSFCSGTNLLLQASSVRSACAQALSLFASNRRAQRLHGQLELWVGAVAAELLSGGSGVGGSASHAVSSGLGAASSLRWGAGALGARARMASAATEAARSTRVVIGGMEDLGPGSLRAGEETLASRLPGDTGSRLGNWLNNRDFLRAAMRDGAPIRDASVDSAGNLLYEDTRRFITMERDYLRSFNWTYDPSTSLWMPPG